MVSVSILSFATFAHLLLPLSRTAGYAAASSLFGPPRSGPSVDPRARGPRVGDEGVTSPAHEYAVRYHLPSSEQDDDITEAEQQQTWPRHREFFVDKGEVPQATGDRHRASPRYYYSPLRLEGVGSSLYNAVVRGLSRSGDASPTSGDIRRAGSSGDLNFQDYQPDPSEVPSRRAQVGPRGQPSTSPPPGRRRTRTRSGSCGAVGGRGRSASRGGGGQVSYLSRRFCMAASNAEQEQDGDDDWREDVSEQQGGKNANGEILGGGGAALHPAQQGQAAPGGPPRNKQEQEDEPDYSLRIDSWEVDAHEAVNLEKLDLVYDVMSRFRYGSSEEEQFTELLRRVPWLATPEGKAWVRRLPWLVDLLKAEILRRQQTSCACVCGVAASALCAAQVAGANCVVCNVDPLLWGRLCSLGAATYCGYESGYVACKESEASSFLSRHSLDLPWIECRRMPYPERSRAGCCSCVRATVDDCFTSHAIACAAGCSDDHSLSLSLPGAGNSRLPLLSSLLPACCCLPRRGGLLSAPFLFPYPHLFDAEVGDNFNLRREQQDSRHPSGANPNRADQAHQLPNHLHQHQEQDRRGYYALLAPQPQSMASSTRTTGRSSSSSSAAGRRCGASLLDKVLNCSKSPWKANILDLYQKLTFVEGFFKEDRWRDFIRNLCWCCRDQDDISHNVRDAFSVCCAARSNKSKREKKDKNHEDLPDQQEQEVDVAHLNRDGGVPWCSGWGMIDMPESLPAEEEQDVEMLKKTETPTDYGFGGLSCCGIAAQTTCNTNRINSAESTSNIGTRSQRAAPIEQEHV